MTDIKKLTDAALKAGFDRAEVIEADKIPVNGEYRKYCEENLCGCYDRLSVCPPGCGTVAEMENRMKGFASALVLQTLVEDDAGELYTNSKKAKARHNELAEIILREIKEDAPSAIMMSAGPWKEYSCLSAYCVDCAELAALCGMKCWENDGKIRYFSVILF